eukprot:CAMPEP_0197848662 /NCGR_PEP_ID=MMETSP1438-20131217/9522_1 /TAXON_ID=1461541 /ORGANISM="Pterosperma sp., Strain CCMP1384" /LENGTH=46 /DNA_ID= /DNA_START= /DNA_END= /DNA_ORIENTATION=
MGESSAAILGAECVEVVMVCSDPPSSFTPAFSSIYLDRLLCLSNCP